MKKRPPSNRETPSPGPTSPASQDILSSVMGRGAFQRQNLDQVLARWLEKQLLSDQYARLEQAGHTNENKIPLARVFVDLEVGNQPREAGSQEAEKLPLGFIYRALRFEPTPFASPLLPPVNFSPIPFRRRYLIIGGPGQGKSTLGQFLCQVHRVALLQGRTVMLGPDGRRLIDAIAEQVAKDGLGLPRVPSFPIRVALGHLATWLVKEQHPSGGALLSYLAQQIHKAIGEIVLTDDLRQWFALCPLVLVLDGLDEVPASGGRGLVMAAIQALLEDLAGTKAQGILIATTRPQGYSGEFGDFQQRSLAPLSRARAVHYSERLIETWWGDQTERREKIMARLQQALDVEATARLMRSPLQVTIMALLVDQIGRAPQERWRIFSEYYRVIYQREMERDIPAAELLKDLRSHIDAIHRHVGLVLQAESEHSGGTEALMTHARLEELVSERLTEAGFSPDEQENLTRKILEAATERLVFLVSPQEGQYGFEIRSLQEFMAAEALMSGGDAAIEARLVQIGKISAWRNVLVFCASRAFANAEASHLRDLFADRLCRRINEDVNDEPAQATLQGSLLALDLLEEGSVLGYPKHARRLIDIALSLLDMPNAPSQRLAALAADRSIGVAGPLLQAIEARLRRPSLCVGAWTTLVALIEADVDGARTLGETFWPQDPEAQQQIVRAGGEVLWLMERIAQQPENFPPMLLFMSNDFIEKLRLHKTIPAWLVSAASVISSQPYDSPQCHLVNGQDEPRNETYISWSLSTIRDNRLSNEWQTLGTMQNPPTSWRHLIAASRILAEPSKNRLAHELRYIASSHSNRTVGWPLPWPLAECLQYVECLQYSTGSIDIESLAASIEAGEMGDASDWIDAEVRWLKNGVHVNELAPTKLGCLLFERMTERTIFPLLSTPRSTTFKKEIALPYLEPLKASWLKMPLGPHKTEMADCLMQTLEILGSQATDYHVPTGFGVEIYSGLLADLERFSSERILDFSLNLLSELSGDPAHVTLIDRLGLIEQPLQKHTVTISTLDIERVKATLAGAGNHFSDILRSDPHRRGVLRLVALIAATKIENPFDKDEDPEPLTFIPDIPDHVLATASESKEIQDEVSVMLLRLAQDQCQPKGFNGLAKQIIGATTEDYQPVWAAINIACYSRLDPHKKVPFLLALLRHTPPSLANVSIEILNILDKGIKARSSALDDPVTWTQLRLPLPRPQHHPGDSARDLAGIIQVDSLAVQNLRCFADLHADFNPATENQGQWIILIGENGVGKSTLLRSLVLALVDPQIANTLLTRSLPRYRQDPALPAEIKLSVNGSIYHARIASANQRESLRTLHERPPPRPPIYAYGCRRGSALGGPDRDVPYGDFEAVATLFDETESLIHAETWLRNLKLTALMQEGHSHLYEQVIEALKRVLPGVDHLEVRPDTSIWVRGPAVGNAPLAAMSDGYLTTSGWIIDLIARWIQREERLGHAIPDNFTETMEGLVMIDEIDMHLHPGWQRHVIPDVRKLFPRMSFVVTTHNALTLLGAEPGEVCILRHASDEGGRIELVQRDLPKGLRADQVLTGEWFNLASTVDPDTLDLLERHRQLVRERASASSEERLRIEAELRQRLGTYADTSVDRMALSAAAEYMDENYGTASPEDRAVVRDKVKGALKRMKAATGRPDDDGN